MTLNYEKTIEVMAMAIASKLNGTFEYFEQPVSVADQLQGAAKAALEALQGELPDVSFLVADIPDNVSPMSQESWPTKVFANSEEGVNIYNQLKNLKRE